MGQKTPMDMSKLDHRHRNYPWDYVREGIPGQLREILYIAMASANRLPVIAHPSSGSSLDTVTTDSVHDDAWIALPSLPFPAMI